MQILKALLKGDAFLPVALLMATPVTFTCKDLYACKCKATAHHTVLMVTKQPQDDVQLIMRP